MKKFVSSIDKCFQKSKSGVDNYFGISKKGSTFVKELIGGVIVFFAMMYILPVNTSILGTTGMPAGGVFAATAICSGLVTIFMGVVARYPVALSAGMGINAYFAFTMCGAFGYSWQEGLAVVLVSGILFFIMTFTPIRKWIIEGIPLSIKHAISAGLGAFICFVGLKMGGIIVPDGSTLVKLGNLADFTVLLALFGIILVFALLSVPNKIVKNLAVIIAMFATAILGLILNLCGVGGMPSFSGDLGNVGDISLIFGKCFDGFSTIFAKPETYAIIFSFIFVNLFDTTATLLAVGKDAGMLDEKGNLVNGKMALIADATGALISGVIGVSPVTSFAESTVGVASGARTGLSACVTGVLFLLALAIYPIFAPFAGVTIDGNLLTPVTSLALVSVGAMMFMSLKHIEWDNKIIVFATFITFIMMVLTYSISDGMAFGLIFYVIMMLAAGKGKDVSIILYVLAVLFAANFIVKEVVEYLHEAPAVTPSALLLEIQSFASYLSVTPLSAIRL